MLLLSLGFGFLFVAALPDKARRAHQEAREARRGAGGIEESSAGRHRNSLVSGQAELADDGAADLVRGDVTEAFSRVYSKHTWGQSGRGSGEGSTINATAIMRKVLTQFIQDKDLSIMVDAPNGGMVWTDVFLNDSWHGANGMSLKYIGLDVVPSVIAGNHARHAADIREKRISIGQVDVTKPKSLSAAVRKGLKNVGITESAWRQRAFLLTRDVVQHWPWSLACTYLRTVLREKASLPRYLLVGGYRHKQLKNRDIPLGGYFPVDLSQNPFKLPPPAQILRDTPNGEGGSGKLLRVWDLDAIPEEFVAESVCNSSIHSQTRL